ncbi:hypothetical protein DFJ73DRAFT_858023 [Zopfochytrium polystomum]|nr:hypothetical protein DFJ73DRAFT_858023 [Zopfochytrium polystomum]
MYPAVDVVAADDDPTLFGSDSPTELPPNLTFLRYSLGDPLPFSNNAFDLVHAQCTLLRIPETGWRTTLDEMRRVGKVGGYLDVVELYRFSQNSGPIAFKYGNEAKRMLEETGVNPYLALKLDSILEDLGTTNVQEGVTILPLNWNGVLGAMTWTLQQKMSAPVWRHLVTSQVLTAEEADRLSSDMGEEYREKRSFFVAYYACGKKA